MGADSRTSMGKKKYEEKNSQFFFLIGSYVSNRVSNKLTPGIFKLLFKNLNSFKFAVHDSIYCCRSGSAADTQAISDYVRYYLEFLE